MKISEIGEFGLIDLISQVISRSRTQAPSWQRLIIGIGDDAAAWQGDRSIQLATIDSLIEGVHFSLDIASWYELGWKALAVNLSDIAAMGGQADYALVALALPDDSEVDDVLQLYRGILDLAQGFDVAVVGGNTSRSPIISINITVLGHQYSKGTILTRSTARAGDLIAVTGSLGAAAAGLEMLTKKLDFDEPSAQFLKNAFLKPVPRLREGGLLAAEGIKSAIDISDGFVADLTHICRASRVAAQVNVDLVPVAPPVKAHFGDRALELALSGGEDYELLFTGDKEAVARVKQTAEIPVTVVGEIVEKKDDCSVWLVDSRGQPVKLNKTGWDHFQS